MKRQEEGAAEEETLDGIADSMDMSLANDHQSNKEKKTNFMKKDKSMEWFTGSEE